MMDPYFDVKTVNTPLRTVFNIFWNCIKAYTGWSTKQCKSQVYFIISIQMMKEGKKEHKVHFDQIERRSINSS